MSLRAIRVSALIAVGIGALLAIQSALVVGYANDSLDRPLISGVDPDTAAKLSAIATADSWTKAQGNSRVSRVVQILDLKDGKSPVSVRFINYESMQAFTVFVDRAALSITDRQLDQDWPDYSPAEVEAASVIALGDQAVRALRTDWIVNNVTGATGGDRCAGRRCIVVFLTPPDNDYKWLRIVTVDLGLEAVVAMEIGE